MSTPVFETADSLIDGSSRAQWRDVAHALIRPSMTSIVVCLATAAAIVGGVMILSASTVCGIVEWHAVHSFKRATKRPMSVARLWHCKRHNFPSVG